MHCHRNTETALTWKTRALDCRRAQDLSGAIDAFARAHELAPRDPPIALGLALTRFEAGLPAAAHFRIAQALAPDDLAIARDAAVNLADEGEYQAAERLLTTRLAAHPDWLDGHRALMTLHTTMGEAERFVESYQQACAALPHHRGLRLAWFHAHAMTRDWPAAREVIAEGERVLGPHRAFVVARAFIAAESGDDAAAGDLFAQLGDVRDLGLDLARLRFALRTGDIATAKSVAERHIGAPTAASFWPYLSVIWRLTNDPRAQGLDDPERFIRVVDLNIPTGELAALAERLRGLHKIKAPFLEQSVRGGTQTDRQLFFRLEPEIAALKTKIDAAVRGYVDALPPPDPAHPLLAPRRDKISYSGSWSVRLSAQGFHVPHTHVRGWISSALYISLPPPARMGQPPAGWISFGSPPSELGLSLAPYAQIEPKPGRLVLFPSTMWHATVPFNDGERLVVAFDVAPTRRNAALMSASSPTPF